MYLIIFIAAYLIITAFGYWLDFLNLSHIKRYGALIPHEFEGEIDQALLTRTRDYQVEQTRFGFISSLFDNVVLLFFLLLVLNIYNSWIISLDFSFIISGLIFFLLITYAETIISIPFSLYRTFYIENRYGFNTMTGRLWAMDTVKALVISTVLMGLIVSVGLLLIQKSPELWWLWLWLFFLFFGIFMMYLSPYMIEPLFHKFSPIDDEGLESGIRALMGKAGIRVSRVFKMDASKRTKHTNAYFTGIGKVKRIVLYDTLIKTMDREEIMSVLAHEAGHWKKRHVLKHIVATETVALIAIYISYHLLDGNLLTDIFRISEPSFYSKLVVLGFLGSVVTFPLGPIFHYISRRHEKEADGYAYELTGDVENLISALMKLSKENLSNLHPHPLYALFKYSHPPVLQRIQNLRMMAKR